MTARTSRLLRACSPSQKSTKSVFGSSHVRKIISNRICVRFRSLVIALLASGIAPQHNLLTECEPAEQTGHT